MSILTDIKLYEILNHKSCAGRMCENFRHLRNWVFRRRSVSHRSSTFRTKKRSETCSYGASCANAAVFATKERKYNRTTHFYRSPTSRLAIHPTHHHNTPRRPEHRNSAFQTALYTITTLSSNKRATRSFWFCNLRTEWAVLCQLVWTWSI